MPFLEQNISGELEQARLLIPVNGSQRNRRQPACKSKENLRRGGGR